MTLRRALHKLRHMSADEVRVRAGQALRRSAERVIGLDQGEPSDRAFAAQLAPGCRADRPEHLVGRLMTRLRHAPFMPGLHDRNATIRAMHERFRDAAGALVARADRAAQGRFDFFGRTWTFGDPIDWRLEPTTGKRAPLMHWSRVPYLDGDAVGDKKILWELNRHGHVVTLGQAYWLTGDERYAEAFVRQVSSWLEQNPPRRGINWASSLEVSFRAMAWLWALHLFAGSARLTAPFLWRLLKALAQHGRYVRAYLSHYFSPNTHLTGEALGLFMLGTTLPELSAAGEWQATGLRILLDQLPQQVQADGVYFEQASYYHRYTADFVLHLILRARAAGITLPGWVDETLCAMLDHLMWVTRPDGRATLYGDDDGGRLVTLSDRAPDDFRDTLALGAALYGREAWKAVAGPSPSEVLWLAGPSALERLDRVESRPPRTRARLFEASGYAVLRSGWDEEAAYLFFDGGPHGALSGGHAHADALSIEFAADGVVWFIDPGTYTYTGDSAARDTFRATQAHNTVTVDGRSQSTLRGPFSWASTAAGRVVAFQGAGDEPAVAGVQDGYAKLHSPVRHERRVALGAGSPQERSRLVITDELASAGRHRYDVRFHLGPGCTVTCEPGYAIVSHVGGQRLAVGMRRMIEGGPGIPVPLAVESGFVSRCYGSRQPVPVLVGSWEAVGPVTLVTAAAPFHGEAPPDWDELFTGRSAQTVSLIPA